MGVQHSFEKKKPQLCFFLKKPSLVLGIILLSIVRPVLCHLSCIYVLLAKADHDC